jgi:hypothetical protein
VARVRARHFPRPRARARRRRHGQDRGGHAPCALLARELFPGEPILFTTYNRNLASNIAGLLDGLCGPERAQIEVYHIHGWAAAYARKQWGKFEIVNADQARLCWSAAVGAGKAALDWTQEDYETEWRDVVQFHGVTSRDEYLKVSRAGCSKPLTRAERARIWDGLAAFRAELHRRGLVVVQRERDSKFDSIRNRGGQRDGARDGGAAGG